jgi:hypothetical protein
MNKRKTVWNQKSEDNDLIKEDTPTRERLASEGRALVLTNQIRFSEVPMPSAHKNQEDMFISAFYDNKEF